MIKRFLFGLLILLIAVPCYAQGLDDETNLLLHANGGDGVKSAFAHLKFESDATDDGTGANSFTGIGTPTYTAGKGGGLGTNALTLDGSTDALNANALETDIVGDNTGSFSLWFNLDVTPAVVDTIFGLFESSTGQEYFRIGLYGANILEIVFVDGGSSQWYHTSTVNTTQWYHLVVVQDGTSPKIYLDGVDITNLVGTTDVTLWFGDWSDGNVNTGRIGSQNYNGEATEKWFFDGQIDDFRYFQNSVLSQTEIDYLYSSFSGTQNSIIVDEKLTSPHTAVQTIADAQLDTAAKKWGTASLLFDGTGDYVTIPDSADFDILADNTADYTIDFQSKLTDSTPQTEIPFSSGDDTSNYMAMQIDNSSRIQFVALSGGTVYLSQSSNYAFSDTGWHHIAEIKNGSYYSIYIDGNQEQYEWSPVEITYTDATFYIASRFDQTASRFFGGNMDEFRVQADNYFLAAPNSFPAAPLLLYGEGTDGDTLLSNADIVDEDMADISDWVDGDTGDAASTQVTFDSKSTMKLDSGSTPNEAVRTRALGSLPNVFSFNVYFDKLGAANGDEMRVELLSDQLFNANCYFRSDGLFVYSGSYVEVGTNIVVLDTWQEYTLVVDWASGTMDVYLDGALAGADVAIQTIGLVSNSVSLRQKGDTSANNISYFDWAKLGSDTLTPNEGYGGIAAQVNGAELSNGATKFNATTSMFFDGTNDYMTVTDTSGTDYDVAGSATDSWTIDFWVKHTDHSGTEGYLTQREDSSNRWILIHYNGSGIRFIANTAGTPFVDFYGGEITDTAWHHIALVKSAQFYGIYIDGAQTGYDLGTSTDTFAASNTIGWDGASSYFDGYMEQVQITKGNKFGVVPNVGLTSTITVPTAVLTQDTITEPAEEYDEESSRRVIVVH